MSRATYYDSDMTGAPLLNGVKGSLTALLDAVLINGFGDKAPLGWSKPFQNADNTIAVYRNHLGTGRYYRVEDDASNITDGHGVARIYSFESMTDYWNGTLGVLSGYIGKNVYCAGTSTNVNKVRWKVIGDNKGFYLMNPIYHDGYGSWYYYEYYHVRYIGDYIPSRMEDRWNSCLLVDYYNSTTLCNQVCRNSGSLHSLTNTAGQGFPYAYSYEPRRVSAGLLTGVTLGSDNIGCASAFNTSVAIRGLSGPINGSHFAGRPILADSENNIRGWLPGMLSFNIGRNYLGNASNSKLIFIDGKKEIYVTCTHPNDYSTESDYVQHRCYCFIDAGEGFRP